MVERQLLEDIVFFLKIEFSLWKNLIVKLKTL